jgi:hypothetical protein
LSKIHRPRHLQREVVCCEQLLMRYDSDTVSVRGLALLYITEIQNLLSNSKVRNVIHSGRITFRVLTNYIPRLGELQSAVMANYNPRSQARPTP